MELSREVESDANCNWLPDDDKGDGEAGNKVLILLLLTLALQIFSPPLCRATASVEIPLSDIRQESHTSLILFYQTACLRVRRRYTDDRRYNAAVNFTFANFTAIDIDDAEAVYYCRHKRSCWWR